MKRLVLIVALLFFQIEYSQENGDFIEIQISGYGANENKALLNALRTAVENAYGVYVSSNTSIINDELIKDEIKTLGRGNVFKYEVIKKEKLGATSSVVVKATVSISKIKAFGQSAGEQVSFEGALFANNLKLQELYEKNEVQSIKNFIETYRNIYSKSIDFELSYSQPQLNQNTGKYSIEFQVDARLNENSQNIEKLLLDLKYISMDLSDVLTYQDLNKPYYAFIISVSKDRDIYLFLRNQESAALFGSNFLSIPLFYATNFVVKDGSSNLIFDEVKAARLGSLAPFLGQPSENNVNIRFKHYVIKDEDNYNIGNYKISPSPWDNKQHQSTSKVPNPSGRGRFIQVSKFELPLYNFGSKLKSIAKEYGSNENRKMIDLLRSIRGGIIGTERIEAGWLLNQSVFIDNKEDIFLQVKLSKEYSQTELGLIKGFQVESYTMERTNIPDWLKY